MDNYSEESPYSVVFEKIRTYRKNSNDITFHAFLDKEAGLAARGEKTPEKLVFELDWAYEKYKEVESNMKSAAPSASYAHANGTAASESNSNKTEFTLGAIVLSIIGAIFLLVALISFGNYYLEDYFQGIILYVAGAATIALSQLLVERRLPKFSHILTAIGFGFLIFTSFFNTFSLGMFNEYVCIVTIFVISAALLVLARFRKSLILEVTCSLGTHALLLFFAFSYVDDLTVALIFVINFAINLALFIAGKDTEGKASAIIRSVTVTLSGALLLLMSASINVLAGIGVGYIFLLLAATFFCERNKPAKWILIIGTALLTVIISTPDFNEGAALIISKVGLLAVCGLFFALRFKSREKWIAYYIVVAALIGSFADVSNIMATMLVYICILVLTKFLAVVADIHECDAVVTTIVLAAAAINYDLPVSFIVPVVALTCIFFTKKWKLYQEFITLIFTAIIVGENVPDSFSGLAIAAVSIAMPLIFTYLDRERPKYFEIFIIASLIFEGICVMLLPGNDMTSDAVQRIIVAASFAITLVGYIFLFNKKTNLEWKGKYIIVAAFATYLSFFLRLENIWISVSLMSVALIVITIGCFVNYKPVRLCGLCLSILVLGKVALYDSLDLSDEKRIIVFFVVGLLAILIGLAYMILEKKENQTKIVSSQTNDNISVYEDIPNTDSDSKENIDV